MAKDFSTSSKPVSLEEARLYLVQLDLGYIIESMCGDRYPLPRWTQADAVYCCQLYKNFLLLQKMHAPIPMVPTREIDEFWHNHILYTQNYLRDCVCIFGHYLHHLPASPADDPQQLVDGFLRTKQLYLEAFHHPMNVMIR